MEKNFRTTHNNANWQNLNKVTNWMNNNRAKTSPYRKVNLTRLDNNNILISPITTDEINLHITKMKKKAPGESKIRYQIIKHLPENIINYLAQIFNASLASGYFPKKF